MNRAYYSDYLHSFLDYDADAILGELVRRASADGSQIETKQIEAWREQIAILKEILRPYRDCGSIYFEYSIPRLGKRIDVLALIKGVIFVIEFKVGETTFANNALDQVCDYALDLKHFHETSHSCPIAPIVVATQAHHNKQISIAYTAHGDNVMHPIRATPGMLCEVIAQVLKFADSPDIDRVEWEAGRYQPTPTIIEAAMALYGGHQVEEISRKDAGAENLAVTSHRIEHIIKSSRTHGWKSICFVTGVPGAGKTLVGLDIATKHFDKDSELYSVFLSGNGPLVAVLREALAKDNVRRQKEKGRRIRIGIAQSEVKAFIQNVRASAS